MIYDLCSVFYVQGSKQTSSSLVNPPPSLGV